MTAPSPASMPQRRTVAGYQMSRHAWQRMTEMDLDPERIEAVLDNPERVWLSPKYKDTHPTCWSYADAEVGVVVDIKTRTVITVVWRHKKVWEARLAAGLIR